MLIGRRRFLINATGCGAFGATIRAAGAIEPRLLVILVAGQFRSDYLDRRGWTFASGGFRRLFRESAFFADCRLSSSSFTASALATLATGAYPSVHGVVAERWFDRATRSEAAAKEGLLAGTLTPEFRAADGRNRVYSIGYQAVAGGADLAFDRDETGQFRVAGKASEWLAHFRQTYNPELSRNMPWKPIHLGPGPEREGPPLRMLAYDATKPAEYSALFHGSPLGLAMEFALARELVLQEGLGRGAGRDLLYVHLDSLASLGQQVGGDSPLMGEMVTHLDRQLATLLDQLDSRAGAGRYQLVFAGAHGVADGKAAATRRGEEVVEIVEKALGKATVDAYFYPFLYLRGATRELRLTAARALVAAGVANSYLTADGDCSHTGEWRVRMQNSFSAARSGDVMVQYPPNVFERFGDAGGISYGSLYNYDSEVPVAFLGPGFQAGLYGRAIESVDVAPTIARAAGIGLPTSSTGQTLTEALSPARWL